jgi:hypothetical protein|tara:strand:+ start:3760 stop:4203 length:444 start_codon:yes stop_codon:yes gene_type:complete
MRHLALALFVVANVLVNARTAQAVPVVPNFTQGSMTTHTETTQTINETINSVNYNTGYTYSVSGTNVQPNTNLAPSSTSSTSNSTNGVTSTWQGLDLDSRPTWSQTNVGAPFQFTEHYVGPGMSNQTIIQRTTTITSITDSTSIFQQ